ncbi:V-ATPase V1 sector subunit E [Ascochyta rabiei]|uniref:Proton-transporting ATPase activity, rotational mechanism n=1 Tax=Didymella rabiei TaxID=5454 RepID=A0A162WCA6_DIDRA|nr:V-ATPase V1 sector subunit E [Ascochyta rabiei]KZM18942.1 proton-transporting ATPase activity, rotational mechanism [Ascochyta rabiei]UPX16251.1 V-ATPase V1 sector subunit E [Ascochyta rabiei]
MSQIHALSDDQVAGELKKMTAFIRQEAMEKANEIRLKADEEFAIEKSKLVRQETSTIDSSYEKKFKQASMSQQITRSTVSNKSRLRILSARQELLDRLFEDAGKKLADVSKDKKKYQAILKALILEGAYALNEDKLQIKVRKADNDVANKAIDEAQTEYKSALNKDVAITIDESDPLPSDSAGGAMIVGTGGRIDINNTLEERLRLLESDALPSIRVTLFGENENRKFRD